LHKAWRFKVKRILPVFLLLALPSLLFANQGFGSFAMRPVIRGDIGPYEKSEILGIQDELGPRKIGDIDVATLLSVRDRLSVAQQKDAYVRSAGVHSFLLPGLGQLEQGDTAVGIGFLAADLAVIAGTCIGVYALLPADLRFDRIDYFGSNFTTINNAWSGHSFTDYLPALAALVGGMVVDQTIRHWSSADARRGAARAIDAGRVQITPRIGTGFMGFNVAY
jgi:hypothetical protein